MIERSYSQQVNRRIAAMRFLLASDKLDKESLNPLEAKTLIESAQQQFYFLIIAYLNELLTHYRRSIPQSLKEELGGMLEGNLKLVLSHAQELFSGIHEYTDIVAWNNENQGILDKLANLPMLFSTLQDSDQGKETTESHRVKAESDNGKDGAVEVNLIVSDVKQQISLENREDLLTLLESFQSLIDHHRAYQAEY